MVKVAFDLRGREWNGKYLTNLNAWKVDRAAGGTASTGTAAATADFPADPFPNYNDAPPVSTDDLPF